MISRGFVRILAAMAGALLAIAAIVWSFLWLWQTAAEIDRKPPRGGLTEQMMHHKTKAMQAVSNRMIRGDLHRVETAAKQLSAYGNAIEWYLSATEYEENDEKFRQSVDDLIAAAQ